tara:strand:- start:195 stop:431 length:237 start_codon:yes stop_codon:yes gene_type:complete
MLHMQVGQTIRLKGITRHGKNRVREQGEFWEVIRINPTVSFKTKAPGPFMLLQAAESINMRWVSTVNDDNFSVEVIDE